MNKKIIITGALSLFGLASLIAQPTLVEKIEAKEGRVVIPYERWKLPNGLTILLNEDHSDPAVHVLVSQTEGQVYVQLMWSEGSYSLPHYWNK